MDNGEKKSREFEGDGSQPPKDIVDVNAVAELLKLSARRVHQLAKEGILPHASRGKYDPVGCVHAYIDYLKMMISGGGDISITDERKRLIKNQADMAELELQKAHGELIETRRAKDIWGDVANAIKQKLIAQPSRLAPLFVGIQNTALAKDKLEVVFREIASECKNPDIARIARQEYRLQLNDPKEEE